MDDSDSSASPACFPGLADITTPSPPYPLTSEASGSRPCRKRILCQDTLQEDSGLVPRKLDLSPKSESFKRRCTTEEHSPAQDNIASSSSRHDASRDSERQKPSLLGLSDTVPAAPPKISLLSLSDISVAEPRHQLLESLYRDRLLSFDMGVAAVAALNQFDDCRRTLSSTVDDKDNTNFSNALERETTELKDLRMELKDLRMDLEDSRIERDWYYKRLVGIEVATKFAKSWCGENGGNVQFEAFLEAIEAQLYND